MKKDFLSFLIFKITNTTRHRQKMLLIKFRQLLNYLYKKMYNQNLISMSTFFNIRKLTISSQYSKLLFKKPVHKPKLTISGDWMQKAGFEIGNKVTISVSENLLIIQKATN
jgi:hypothetical protein